MALTSTLYTGLSGLNVNQKKLNVIGNNIANVNTVAFKSSRALFKPQFYVTDIAGSPPTGEFGGTNPSQRGLGASVATIQKNFNPGSIETTGIGTDLAIDGQGFFIVGSQNNQMYTRDGSFVLNENNELVSSRGEYVRGYAVDRDFNVIPGQLSNISVPLGGMTIASATSKVDFKGNLNSSGQKSTGASILESQALLDQAGDPPTDATTLLDLRLASDTTTPIFADGQTLSLQGRRGGNTLSPLTFTIDASTTITELNNFFRAGMAIDTSTDTVANAPTGYTPGVGLTTSTAAGDPPGSLRLAITGNAGTANALEIAGTAFSTSSGSVPFAFNHSASSQAVGESMRTSMVVYDSLGTPVTLDLVMTLESSDGATGGTKWRYFATSPNDTDLNDIAGLPADTGSLLGSGTVEFDAHGVFRSAANNSITIDRDETGAVSPVVVNLDFTQVTSLKSEKSQVVLDDQDGFATGDLADFSIGADGTVTGFFTNGLERSLGRVAIANFDNPEGLIDQGNNNYSIGASSGQPIITEPGMFNTGLVRSGALEQSNVDLSKEFIDMIVTSTGFSAASRVISTSDQLLNELLQTTR